MAALIGSATHDIARAGSNWIARTTSDHPDLTAYGLPRPSAPFSQFRRTATVPILDVGFVDAVRAGAIEVVPGVVARAKVGLSCWPMGHEYTQTPSWQRLAITPAWSRSSATSQRSETTASRARSHTYISWESAYRSPGTCTRWERMPGG